MSPLHAHSALPSTAPYSLHVCNIPADMGKAGLKNLFAKFGEVTEIFLNMKSKAPNGLLWGRVDFANAIDGQRAMNEVDGDRSKGGLRVREFKAVANRSISTTASSAADSVEAAEAKKAANQVRDAEDRAKLEEFTAKGGVGMELPEARAAVAQAQRLLAAQEKAVEAKAVMGERPAALRLRRPQLRREDHLLNSDSDPNGEPDFATADLSAPPPSEASSYTYGRPLVLSGVFPTQTCHLCEADGMVRCTVCFAWYCSLKCQREDWMTYHHQICRQIPPAQFEDGTPVRRPGDQLRQPNQVAVAAPAEKELAQAARALEKQVALAEAEEQKEVKIVVKTSKPVAAAAAAEVAPPTANAVARPRVEAPGKADTVKMGTKVVGSDGTKEKAQARIQRTAEITKTTAATEAPIVKATRDDEPRRPLALESMKLDPLSPGDEVAFVDFDQTADMAVVQKVTAFDQLGQMLEIMAELKARPATLEPVADPRKGEVLSSKWSGPEGDESFYRAAVTRVDSEKKKVEVQFVDFGNRAVEGFESLAALPGKARNVPLLSHTVKLSGVPSAPLTEPKVETQVEVLRPLLEIPVRVKSIEGSEVVLECEDKRTVNDIVAEKVSSATVPASKIQGEVIGGAYLFEDCAVAEMAVDASAEQTAVVLNVESAAEIYLAAHKAHTTLVEKIIEKVSNYGTIKAKDAGFAPPSGQVCVAKSSADDTWYRAVAVDATTDDKVTLFFADFGFMEDVSRSNILPAVPEVMGEPFLSNHCVLDGFDAMHPDTRAKVGELLVANLQIFHDVSVVVVEGKDGVLIVRIPALAKKIAEIIEICEMERKLAARKAALT